MSAVKKKGGEMRLQEREGVVASWGNVIRKSVLNRMTF